MASADLSDLQVRDIRVLRGPNVYRLGPVIACNIRLGALARAQAAHVSAAYAAIHVNFSEVDRQACPRRSRATFRDCLRELADVPHVIEHIALALQSLAGANVSYGYSKRSGEPDTWRLALEYEEELPGLESLLFAVEIMRGCFACQSFDLQRVVERIRHSLASARPDSAASAVISEARRRGIPARRLGLPGLVQLGLGRNLRRLKGVLSDATSAAAVNIARDPEAVRHLLLGAGVPLPLAGAGTRLDQASGVTQKARYPAELRPAQGIERETACDSLDDEHHFRGVSSARGQKQAHVTEQGVYERDYIILVVGDQVCSAVERIRASVTGDGGSTVRELIQRAQMEFVAKQDTDLIRTLAAQGCSLDSVPDTGKVVILPAGNVRDGCVELADRSDQIHPENRIACEVAARVLKLPIAAVEFRSVDISVPWSQNEGRILRVDPIPDLSLLASGGETPVRAVASYLIETLYPAGTNASIPVVAVTGTNGKTTTTRLIAHLLAPRYGTVGMRTTDGVYVGVSERVADSRYRDGRNARSVHANSRRPQP